MESRDSDGYTPLLCAAQKSEARVVALLTQRGAALTESARELIICRDAFDWDKWPDVRLPGDEDPLGLESLFCS